MDDQVIDTFSPPTSPGVARTIAPPRQAAVMGRPVVVAGAVYAVTALTSRLACTALGATVTPRVAIVALPAGLVLSVLAASGGARVRRAATLWVFLLAVFAAACVASLATVGLPERPYGDGAMFAAFVAEGRVVPRWLVGGAAAASAHAAVWDGPLIRAVVPEGLHSPTAYLGVLGSLVMVAGTWGVSRRWPGRLAVLLPAMTPVWVLFASGYVEYYPLVAVPLVATLAWAFERPLEERSPVAVGVAVASLPLLYVGFVPTAGLLLAAYMAVRPARALVAAALAAGLAAITIPICWPQGIVSYFHTLQAVMNVGDANLPPRYAGQVASATSIMFAVDAVLSWGRVREVLYMLTWGAGAWTLPALLVVACRASLASGGTWRQTVRDVRLWLGVALVGWHLYYLAFMVPRLGPTADIDLFFSTYMILAFMIGLLLDRTRTDSSPAWAAAAVACALASLACAGPWLVWLGLPQVP